VAGGPFEVTKFEQGATMILQRNPFFYGPKALLDRIGFQYFGNEDAKIKAFKRHEVGYVDEVPPTAVAGLRKAGLVVSQWPWTAVDFIGFNSNTEKPRQRELLDPTVRLALAHAIDRKEIIKVAWLGFAQPGASVVPLAAGSWSDPSLKPETYDPGLANTLLDQAGYRRGSDGIRIAGDHRMEYQAVDLGIGGGNPREFELVKDELAKIGVVIERQSPDLAAGLAAVQGPDGKYLSNDMDAGEFGVPTDPGFELSLFTCAARGGFSDTGYCDPAYEALYRQQAAVQDEAERRQIVFHMQELLYQSKPWIVIDYPLDLEGHSRDWTGFVPNPALLGSKLWITGIHHV
jgi:peptide/nickel transport system substrate-binding protein